MWQMLASIEHPLYTEPPHHSTPSVYHQRKGRASRGCLPSSLVLLRSQGGSVPASSGAWWLSSSLWGGGGGPRWWQSLGLAGPPLAPVSHLRWTPGPLGWLEEPLDGFPLFLWSPWAKLLTAAGLPGASPCWGRRAGPGRKARARGALRGPQPGPATPSPLGRERGSCWPPWSRPGSQANAGQADCTLPSVSSLRGCETPGEMSRP